MTQQMERDAANETAPPPAETHATQGETAHPSGVARDAGADHLGRIRVRATVELGASQMLVRDVAKLRPGSVVQLERLVGEPADLVVNGLLLARGNVVVVDDHLGLRITEMVSADAD
jgi:flagellar motor switch protein FliN/FliY